MNFDIMSLIIGILIGTFLLGGMVRSLAGNLGIS